MTSAKPSADWEALRAITRAGHPDPGAAARTHLAEPSRRGLAAIALARVGTAADVAAIDAAAAGLTGKDELRQRLAATLIRARFGLELPAITPPSTLDLTTANMEVEELHFAPARDRDAADAKRFVANEALGFEPGGAWALRSEPWTRSGCRGVVVPNAEVLDDPVGRTRRAPALIACVARYDIEHGGPVLDLWVVSRPHGESVLLTAHSAGGFLFYAGRAQSDGSGLRFSMATTDEQPMRPVAIVGRIAPGGALEEVSARRAVRWRSRAKPLELATRR